MTIVFSLLNQYETSNFPTNNKSSETPRIDLEFSQQFRQKESSEGKTSHATSSNDFFLKFWLSLLKDKP